MNLKIFKLSLLSLIFSCASPKYYERGPLFEQRLVARPGTPGKLSNQVCRKYDSHGKCSQMDQILYDLADPLIREQLRNVKIICNVGCKRFRIDRNRPGLVSQTIKKHFLKKPELIELQFIDAIKGWQHMVDAATWCAAQDSFLGRNMFTNPFVSSCISER
jgi:hypothetical protein